MSSENPEYKKPEKKSRFVTKDPNKKKKNLFVRETNTLDQARVYAENDSLSPEEKNQRFKEMCDSYEDLLDQTKLITKVSDRLQNKINTANSKLGEKNEELQTTIDALTKAKVGRKATTYVLIIAVVLFIVSEAFIEPPIERYMHTQFADPNDATAVTNAEWYAGLGLKGIVALLIKPIEMIVERTLMKQAQRNARKEDAAKEKAKKNTPFPPTATA